MNYIGIDPGVSGGIAMIDECLTVVNVTEMPPTDLELFDTVSAMAALAQCIAVIEKLGGMPRINKPAKCKRCGAVVFTSQAMQSPKSMLTLGTNYGLLRMALTATDIPFDDALPKTWQSMFGLVFSADQKLTPSQKKNRHKAKAEQLFPGVKVTHAIADALLIAEYCRRIMGTLGIEATQ